ncbi:MAG: HAMP domain-containing sensor histidine kinase [Candidatus Aureabacteria bacterium]|nr:HAMP domain-containing sensor histidine kinase [Candidatus Auribacterota bacterium]
MFSSVSSRLTLWYAALFAALSVTVFAAIYIMLKTNLSQRMDKALLNEAAEFKELYRIEGIEALRAEFQRETASEGIRNVFFRFYSSRPSECASSDLSGWTGLEPLPGEAAKLKPGAEFFKTISLPGNEHAARVIYKKLDNGAVIQIGYTCKNDDELISHYRMIFGMGIAVMLLFGGAAGWYVANKAMRGVERVTHLAAHIGKNDFTRRVAPGNEGREIANLARAFNNMLERIQALVAELKEVTNGIAHDIRSPLTRIRGIAETTLTGPAHIDAYREMAGIIIEECDRLMGMINTTLEIAETESGSAVLPKSPVDLTTLVRTAHELFRPLAEDKAILFTIDVPPETFFTMGDISRLQRALAHLVDNAIKYTPSGGRIAIATEANRAHVRISMTDSGIGISERDLPHIFERFYRGDKSRSAPGNGLGLSLANSIIRAHGGEITATSNPGTGSSFIITLTRIFPET